LLLTVGWFLLALAWAVYVLGDNCFEGPCSFTDREKTVAVIQAAIAAAGLVVAGFALVQGARYALTARTSAFTKQAWQIACGLFAVWIVFLLLALWL
jgi:hypothetical protein